MSSEKPMIYIAADSWGFSLHKALLNYLNEQHGDDVEVIDYGVYSKYYEAAHAVGLEVERSVMSKAADAGSAGSSTTPVRGILICGSGQGMAVVANKFKHVYACLCTNPEEAQGCRAVNNSNILTLGARGTDEATAKAILDAWLATKFTQGLAANLQELVATSMPEISALDSSHTAQRRLADAVQPGEEEN